MCTLIRHTWTHTNICTDTQGNTTVLLTRVLWGFWQAGACNYPCGLPVWASLLLLLLLPLFFFFPFLLTFLTSALCAHEILGFHTYQFNAILNNLCTETNKTFAHHPFTFITEKTDLTVDYILQTRMSDEGAPCLLKGGNEWCHSATCWQNLSVRFCVWVYQEELCSFRSLLWLYISLLIPLFNFIYINKQNIIMKKKEALQKKKMCVYLLQ